LMSSKWLGGMDGRIDCFLTLPPFQNRFNAKL
jgi:hypothetical protein